MEWGEWNIAFPGGYGDGGVLQDCPGMEPFPPQVDMSANLSFIKRDGQIDKAGLKVRNEAFNKF